MKTNNLIFKIDRHSKNGDQYKIEIELNDKCGNGSQNFYITGMVWEKGKARIDVNCIGAGAIGWG